MCAPGFVSPAALPRLERWPPAVRAAQMNAMGGAGGFPAFNPAGAAEEPAGEEDDDGAWEIWFRNSVGAFERRMTFLYTTITALASACSFSVQSVAPRRISASHRQSALQFK